MVRRYVKRGSVQRGTAVHEKRGWYSAVWQYVKKGVGTAWYGGTARCQNTRWYARGFARLKRSIKLLPLSGVSDSPRRRGESLTPESGKSNRAQLASRQTK